MSVTAELVMTRVDGVEARANKWRSVKKKTRQISVIRMCHKQEFLTFAQCFRFKSALILFPQDRCEATLFVEAAEFATRWQTRSPINCVYAFLKKAVGQIMVALPWCGFFGVLCEKPDVALSGLDYSRHFARTVSTRSVSKTQAHSQVIVARNGVVDINKRRGQAGTTALLSADESGQFYITSESY